MPETKTSWRHIKKKDCPHFSGARETKPASASCAKCGEKTHLRACLACGYVACCESHKAHNTEHFKRTGHPLIRPHRCDYDWLWCYKCNAFLE